MGPPPCAAVRPWDAATGRLACSGPLRKERFLLSLHQTEQLSKTDTLHPAGVRQAGKGEYTLHPLSRLPQKCTGSNVLSHLHRSSKHTRHTSCARSGFGSPFSKPSLQTLQTDWLPALPERRAQDCRAPWSPQHSGIRHSG